MERDSKLGYGFLLVGAALPYLADKLFGPVTAVISAAIVLILGVMFLIAAHYPVAKRTVAMTVWLFTLYGAGVGALGGGITGLVRNIQNASKTKSPPSSTSAQTSAPTSLTAIQPSAQTTSPPTQTGPSAAPTKFHAAPTDDPVGNLSKLGWTVKRDGKILQFEIANSPLPNMVDSVHYFTEVGEPFKLHFQGVPNLVGLDKVSRVDKCEEIEINASELTAISDLSGFTNLKRLTIAQVPLNNRNIIDSSPLAALVNLENLSLSGSRFTDVAYIGTMSKLKTLSIGGTLIRDISPVAALHGLTNVDVRDSKVSDLSPLAQSKALKELSIDGKQVESLGSLSAIAIDRLTIIEQGTVNLNPVGSLREPLRRRLM